MEELNIQEKQQHEIAAALMQKYGEVYFIKAEEFNEIVEKINEIVSDKAGNEAIEEINEILDEKANASDLVNYLENPEIATGKQYALIKSGSSWSWAEVATLATGDISLSVPRKIDTNGNPFSIEELPDKRLDATFNQFLGMNSAGQFGHIGFEAFRAEAESWNDEQRKEFAQKLNGNFSNVGVSVNLISPPVFELENNDVYVVLRGANLNLHPTNRKIEILDASDETVLAEVPNGQVQTYADGLQLVFYYNFNALGVGTFKLKITNGAATYITTHNFQIVAEVTNIDLNGNTFDILTSYANTESFSTNDGVVYVGETAGTQTSTPIFSAKSDELFAALDDWYLEVGIDWLNSSNGDSTPRSRIGIVDSSIANSLIFSHMHYLSLWRQSIGTNKRSMSQLYGGAVVEGSVATTLDAKIAFIKQGNIITAIYGTRMSSITLSGASGFSLLLQCPNRTWSETFSAQIIKAYKFN